MVVYRYRRFNSELVKLGEEKIEIYKRYPLKYVKFKIDH